MKLQDAVIALACTSGLALAPAMARAHGTPHARAAAAAKEQKPWGIAGEARDAKRTIVITMNDRMRFVPDRIEVREGETVRLMVRNAGKVLHELVLGTREELRAHAALMRQFPNMEHDEPHMAHVGAGKTAPLVWNFNRPGEFEFACLIAGHFEAAMVGTIRVVSAMTSSDPQGKQ